jgi:hypothetical protein
MSTLLLGHNADALIGDLIEQHRRGRSSAWYWRQAVRAIVATFAAEMRQHKSLALSRSSRFRVASSQEADPGIV